MKKVHTGTWGVMKYVKEEGDVHALAVTGWLLKVQPQTADRRPQRYIRQPSRCQSMVAPQRRASNRQAGAFDPSTAARSPPKRGLDSRVPEPWNTAWLHTASPSQNTPLTSTQLSSTLLLAADSNHNLAPSHQVVKSQCPSPSTRSWLPPPPRSAGSPHSSRAMPKASA